MTYGESIIALAVVGAWLAYLAYRVLLMRFYALRQSARISLLEDKLEYVKESLSDTRKVLGAVVSDPALVCEHGILRTLPCAICTTIGDVAGAERGGVY